MFEKLSCCLSVRWQKMALLVLRRVGLSVGQNQMCHLWVGFLACALTVSIRIVADCVALSCQVARKLKRATPLEFTTVSAIIFIHCYLLGLFQFVSIFPLFKCIFSTLKNSTYIFNYVFIFK